MSEREPAMTEAKPGTPKAPTVDRLDSWKEIAAHLGCSRRTAQRWEKRGLPIRRHLHDQRGTVYAYKSEVDAWRHSRGPEFQRHEPTIPGIPERWRLGAALMLLPSLLLLTAWAYDRWDAYRNGTPSQPPTDSIVHRHVPGPPDLMLLSGPSPDGRFLPYADENGDLALFEITTQQKRLLTLKGTWEESKDHAGVAAVSPSGRDVAYAWYESRARRMELRVVSLSGGAPRVLERSPDVEDITVLSWSPDGDTIAACFVTTRGTHRIVVVEAETGSTRVLKSSNEGFPRGMSLSPDGRFLAYDWPRPEGARVRDLYVIELIEGESSLEFPLLMRNASDSHPLWTPDGAGVLFASNQTGTFGVSMLDVSEGRARGEPKLLQRDMGRSVPLGLTRDGAYFYFQQTGMADVWISGLDPLTGSVSGEPSLASERYFGNNVWVEWSSDGHRLAYVWGGPGPSINPTAIVIQELSSREERPIVLELLSVARPRFSPDGRFVFVKGYDPGGQRGLFRLDLSTEELEPVFYRKAFTDVELSHDGREILFHSGRSIWARELTTGEEREIYRGVMNNFALSPDGQWVGFSKRTDEGGVSLFVAPLAGGEPVKLFTSDAWLSVEDWTPDGAAVLFVRASEGDRRPLWRAEIDGGRARPLGLALQDLREVRVHPDGGRIAFVAGAPYLEVWVLENALAGS